MLLDIRLKFGARNMLLIMVLVACCYIDVARGSGSIVDVSLLPYKRGSGFLPIIFADSQEDTTQLLVLTCSHGNPPPGTSKYASKTQGGDWSLLVYGGDDDKSVEIYHRTVTKTNKKILGEIDTKNGAASLFMIEFNKILTFGNKQGKSMTTGPVIFNTNGSKDTLVVFASDNAGDSKMADYKFKVGTDDPSFFYLMKDGSFQDDTIGKRRGAIAAIEISNFDTAPPSDPEPSNKPVVTTSAFTIEWKQGRVVDVPKSESRIGTRLQMWENMG